MKKTLYILLSLLGLSLTACNDSHDWLDPQPYYCDCPTDNPPHREHTPDDDRTDW